MSEEAAYLTGKDAGYRDGKIGQFNATPPANIPAAPYQRGYRHGFKAGSEE